MKVDRRVESIIYSFDIYGVKRLIVKAHGDGTLLLKQTASGHEYWDDLSPSPGRAYGSTPEEAMTLAIEVAKRDVANAKSVLEARETLLRDLHKARSRERDVT